MTPSNMLLMFDQVEKALIRQGKEWYSLGEHEVDNLIPDMYKRLRGWVYGRTAEWHYSENGLVVENAIPPLLAQYPHHHPTPSPRCHKRPRNPRGSVSPNKGLRVNPGRTRRYF